MAGRGAPDYCPTAPEAQVDGRLEPGIPDPPAAELLDWQDIKAVGAEVRLFWDGKQQAQIVSGGDGYASQRQRRLHFGLGAATRIDKVVIQWPSGRTQTEATPYSAASRHPSSTKVSSSSGRSSE